MYENVEIVHFSCHLTGFAAKIPGRVELSGITQSYK